MKKLHKKHVLTFVFFAISVLACRKEEPYYTSPPRIVEVAFSGSTSVHLEFVYDNIVVDSTKGVTPSFPSAFQLNVQKGDQKIYVREKGKKDILRTYDLDPKSYRQQFGILYEDGKIFDNSIPFQLMIMSTIKGMEIYLDDKFVLDDPYGGITIRTLTVPINKGQERVITVRKKGSAEILISRKISDVNPKDTLRFYMDANRLIENIKIPDLKNPESMSLTFLFEPDVEFGQSKFLGGDVDFVLYIRDAQFEGATKVSPEFRVTVPAGQQLVSMELPPIPKDSYYTFDILKKGTNEPAYSSITPSYTVRPALGRAGLFGFNYPVDFVAFVPGIKMFCTIGAAEEPGGPDFDQLFITPSVKGIHNLFVNIE